MNRPNEELMRRYGTEADFLEKEAGMSPFAQRLLFAMLTARLATHIGSEMSQQRQQAVEMNDAIRMLQMQRMASTIANIQHSQAPIFAPPGADLGYAPYPVPIGMDAGMVRVASALGAEMAQMDKEAGIMSGLAGMASKVPQLAKPLTAMGRGLQKPFAMGAGALQQAGHSIAGAAQTPVVGKALGRMGGSVEWGGAKALQRMGQPSAMPLSRQAQGFQRLEGVRATEQAMGKPVGSLVPHVPTMGERAGAAAKSVGQKALGYGLVGAGLLGAGAYMASKPVLGYLSGEQPPADWAGTSYGAPQLAHGINQYGQPQLGAPFIR